MEKERKRKAHAAKVLKRKAGESPSGSSSKKSKKEDKQTFTKLLEARTKGFQIEFAFRNAPPRPPVGPCFVGETLESILQENAKPTYGAVQANHKWKLHAPVDLGVPIAPSALDLRSYNKVPEDIPDLHPDDAAILDWEGHSGDSAAEALKLSQDRARAEARAILTGRALPKISKAATTLHKAKKAYSRVLDDPLQTWMKKTTYLSNDYTRKVHDFKSLAQTKKELAVDLKAKQTELDKRRSESAIVKSFEADDANLKHPTRKHLKPKKIRRVLPHVQEWGKSFTHLIIDKRPTLPDQYDIESLHDGLVTNVEKREANARMTCQVSVPAKDVPEEGKDLESPYQSVHAFDLDVVPLKEGDVPHSNFCLWMDGDVVYYVPISSRVQLSTGRPGPSVIQAVGRREISVAELTEQEERMAQVDQDMAEKHHMDDTPEETFVTTKPPASAASKTDGEEKSDDDGEDDFGDDDSSEDEPML